MLDIVRLSEVNKHFGVHRPYIILLLTISVERKAKFQLQVSENKFVIFSPPKFTDPRLTTADLKA
jgi:hypothetical protein